VDLHQLRLVSLRMNLSDPTLTSHLSLRMDKAPFFSTNNSHTVDQIRRWLTNRRTLVIDDEHSNISASRVAYLVRNGFLDSVSDIVVMDCHFHLNIISILSHLPNLMSLKLVDRGGEDVLEDLEAIVAHVGRITSLQHLDVEFDCVVSGSRLSIIREMRNLKYLRLRGFDLSDGLHHMSKLHSLEKLHLCHGNFYSSPSNDVNEKDLLHLKGLQHITSLHLEGFDCLSGVGMSPFVSNSITDLVLKHCQESSEDCLSAIGRMTKLKSLHMINNECDDAPIFGSENLHHLNMLSELKALSLFYVFEEPSDLSCLKGLTSLETLNLAYEYPMEDDEIEEVIIPLLSTFPHLRKLRIFSPDGMAYSLKNGSLDIEFSSYSFGDLVHLD